jgi:hypothetical protein
MTVQLIQPGTQRRSDPSAGLYHVAAVLEQWREQHEAALALRLQSVALAADEPVDLRQARESQSAGVDILAAELMSLCW